MSKRRPLTDTNKHRAESIRVTKRAKAKEREGKKKPNANNEPKFSPE